MDKVTVSICAILLCGTVIMLRQVAPAPPAATLPASQGALMADGKRLNLLDGLDHEYRTIAARLRGAFVNVFVDRVEPEIANVEFAGTLIDGEGHVVIPASGVEGSAGISRIYVKTLDNRSFAAELYTYFPKAPVAILKLAGPSLPTPPRVAASVDVRVGDTVAVVSHTLGLEGSTNFGTVSGVGRRLPRIPDIDLLQTTIDYVSGMPGGVAGNRYGEIIGIAIGGPELVDWSQVTYFNVPSGMDAGTSGPPSAPGAGLRIGTPGTTQRTEVRTVRAPGVSLILPIEPILQFLREFHSSVQGTDPAAKADGRPLVGFVLNERLDPVLRSHLIFGSDGGLVVDEVLEGTPAMRAGIKKNDIIIRAGGSNVGSNLEFTQKLMSVAATGVLRLELIRDGKWMATEVSLSQ